jgi:hypothetical protein
MYVILSSVLSIPGLRGTSPSELNQLKYERPHAVRKYDGHLF